MAHSPATYQQELTEYRSIRFALRHGKALRLSLAVALAMVLSWVGTRTGLPELWAIGLVSGFALNYLAKVALEVLALVADTLIPQ